MNQNCADISPMVAVLHQADPEPVMVNGGILTELVLAEISKLLVPGEK